MAFHWRDGVTFQRQDDGRVDMFVPLEPGSDKGRLHHIPPDEWVSIIAAVSASGQTSEQYRNANLLHNFTGIIMSTIPLYEP